MVCTYLPVRTQSVERTSEGILGNVFLTSPVVPVLLFLISYYVGMIGVIDLTVKLTNRVFMR